MPQLVICHKCRAVLYESVEELKSTDEIIQGYDGRCPTCGKKLSYIPKKVEVNSVDEMHARNSKSDWRPIDPHSSFKS